MIFCERAQAEAEIVAVPGRLVGGASSRQRDDVALMASRCADKLRGLGKRYICGEARAHGIVRDTLEYALGPRASQFVGAELSGAQRRALAYGRLARINALRPAAGGAPRAPEDTRHAVGTPLAALALPASFRRRWEALAAAGAARASLRRG